MIKIGRKVRTAVLVLAVTAIAGISVSASDFAGRGTIDRGVVAPAVLLAPSAGLTATAVQFRPAGYYDRWGRFHYYSYPWVYSGRYRDDFRFRRGDWDDRFRRGRDWDDRHRRDWDDRRHFRR
jgi:hypothetical protein